MKNEEEEEDILVMLIASASGTIWITVSAYVHIFRLIFTTSWRLLG